MTFFNTCVPRSGLCSAKLVTRHRRQMRSSQVTLARVLVAPALGLARKTKCISSFLAILELRKFIKFNKCLTRMNRGGRDKLLVFHGLQLTNRSLAVLSLRFCSGVRCDAGNLESAVCIIWPTFSIFAAQKWLLLVLLLLI